MIGVLPLPAAPQLLFPFSLQLPQGMAFSMMLTFIAVGCAGMASLWVSGKRGALLPAALQLGGAVAALAARDLVSLLIAWELLTVSGFALIRYQTSSYRLHAALRYFVIHIAAAMLLMIAMIIQARVQGSLAIAMLVPAAQPFAAAAVCIKTGVVPFHAWLVKTYPEVDPDVTPVLAAFTTKVAIISGMRLLQLPAAGIAVLAIVGLISILVAGVAAVRQNNLRRMFCWGLSSQLGYLLLLAAIMQPRHYQLLYGIIIAHTLYQTGMFITLAGISKRYGHEDLRRMLYEARVSWFTVGLMVVFILSMIGFPYTMGFIGKELTKLFPLSRPLMLVVEVGYTLHLLAALKAAAVLFRNGPLSSSRVYLQRPLHHSMVAAGLPAMLTIVFGLLPQLLPGFQLDPEISLPGLVPFMLRIITAAGLWVLLRRQIIHQVAVDLRRDAWFAASPLQAALTKSLLPLRYAARVVHSIGPQRQVLLLLVSVMALHLLLVTLGGAG
ncbi:proton-conducting transporter membrane subunit [Spirochaeta africana]|uniref:Formate hydrogenlyase subunit 3/multisubunit Na+/H+ antiporter, MnhD subunit n=1 Tax=Spirochaeta africana (strain ATCC 700263 / DSM 8902 / Z-7692) TaxID=889378 RepID=H9UI54_SPIAZ|nr:proton-conducting transporter membrane subunit [Spirochaeta africana]AFG37197.1 formate hydrogenlyase subunit 3/multisubunit Na+/H+ antiporter, MnhD subunit [Spirochaeta africana DSM 8902]